MSLPPGFRLGLDATLADERTTGIGLVGRELSLALERQGVVVSKLGAARSGDAPRGRASRTVWTVANLPRALEQQRVDVYHALGNFNLPLLHPGRPRLVLTVHDVIPLELPDTVSRAFRWQFRLWLSRSLEVADRVVCVSETTRQGLLRHFEVPERKLRVIPNGVDHVERAPAPDGTTLQWIDSLALQPNVVLYAGALDARKNVGLVVDACTELTAQGEKLTLLVVGQKWFGSTAISRKVADAKSMGLDVRPLGYLADPVFFALMRRATAFVFPSRAEGFGLPPLEAMWLGTPTIVSDVGALPEVVGNGALKVGPDDAPALAESLRMLFHSPQKRAALSRAGQKQAQKYRWDDVAHAYADVYAEALEEPARRL
jgi:glycosyltransferase involved in cell wall biosynthesis